MSRELTQVLTALTHDAVHPALIAEGLRHLRKRLWWEGDREHGFVILELQRSKWNTKERVEFTINTHAWPPGTTEIREEVFGSPVEQPEWGGQAPIFERPAQIDRGLRPRRRLWQLRPPPEHAWWEMTRLSSVDRVTEQVVRFCVESALPFARRHLQPDVAVDRLLQSPGIWGPINAIAVLERCRPDDPRLPGMIDALDRRWRADPRPDTLGPVLDRWKRRG